MPNTLAIWLPTYKRPNTLQVVADNIRAVTKNTYTLYFGVEPEDQASIEAAYMVKGAVVVVNKYEMGYSNAIQSMYEESKEPFAFHANDDFEFLDKWDEHPIAMFETPQVMVVGVPQNEADKTYSAICFIRRKYIETQSGVIDMPNRVFYPYKHNYQDTEFTRTAQSRSVWFSSSNPCINHLHPGFTGKEKDEVYLKNDATIEEDKKTFESRQHLW
jgi:hypothetical protein